MQGVRRVYTTVGTQVGSGSVHCPPSEAVAEGPLCGLSSGDALARARTGLTTPTGDQPTQPRRVNNTFRYSSAGLRLVFAGRHWLTLGPLGRGYHQCRCPQTTPPPRPQTETSPWQDSSPACLLRVVCLWPGLGLRPPAYGLIYTESEVRGLGYACLVYRVRGTRTRLRLS